MPPAPPVRAVVFDLDGLMFNTEDVFGLAGVELLRRRGHEFTAATRKRMMGRRGDEAIAAMIEDVGLTEPVDVLRRESRTIFHALLDEHLAPMPGLFDLLEAIEVRGLPKGLATSSPRSFVERVFAQFALGPRFGFVLTAEDVTQGKPHPEIYLTAAKRHGVEPSEMLVLEDSETGTRAAAAAGAVTVAVPSTHSADHDFTPATYVADGLSDPWIRQALGE